MFYLPNQAGVLVFMEPALDHMYQYAQHHFFQKEAGGQLFSPAPERPDVLIDVATGPNRGDTRRRHGFVPDVEQATRDRYHQFAIERHVVGLWHTHPEPVPSPSSQDLQTARDYLMAFGSSMDGFLLVTLGNAGVPLNMAVWLVHRSLAESGVLLSEV